MYGYIYKYTMIPTGKIYVGQHKFDKQCLDENYWGGGVLWEDDLTLFGKEAVNREILEFCEENNINEREQFWISSLNATNLDVGYNVAIGGQGHGVAWNKSLNKDTNPSMRLLSEMRKKQLEERPIGFIGRTGTSNHKVSQIKIDNAVRDGVIDFWFDHTKTATMKKYCLGKVEFALLCEQYNLVDDEEHRKRASDLVRKIDSDKHLNNPYGKLNKGSPKKVLCVELNQVFNSLQDAGHFIGHVSGNKISDCIKDKTETAGGYHWILVKNN